MKLPVSNEYLELALREHRIVGNVALSQRIIGKLLLPSGRLVACDPLVCPETEPFEMRLLRGEFPVVLSVGQIGDDERVAFASVRLTRSDPTSWKILSVSGQDAETLENGEYFGYPVDAGIGCFMDAEAGKALVGRMDADPEFFRQLIDEMGKTYVYTWSWMDMRFGNANLIAFSSGYGDGLYGTYAGFDDSDKPCIVVTDFGIVDENQI